MKQETHRKLEQMRAEVGRDYGKLVQKLLAVAFLETDVQKLVERSTQGIDLEMQIAGERCVFEVKTSESNSIRLSAKDFEGLDRLVEDGASVYIAALMNGPLESWILARYTAGEFPAGKDLSSFPFRAHRDSDLERRILTAFDRVVDRDVHTAITRRQGGMDEVLQGYPAWGRA
ncbi:MAG: hypothetical protein JRH01_23070 [Deltaproteobacteria bacterium]|nr:hypothetical protein [Deltaproteobacteria bacterium]